MVVIYRKKLMKHCRSKAMAIILRLDRVMADRKISLNDLSEKVGIAM